MTKLGAAAVGRRNSQGRQWRDSGDGRRRVSGEAWARRRLRQDVGQHGEEDGDDDALCSDLERRRSSAGAGTRAGELGSRMATTLGCIIKSWEGSGRCARAWEVEGRGPQALGMAHLAGVEEIRRRQGGSPVIQYDRLGAIWRGLLGG